MKNLHESTQHMNLPTTDHEPETWVLTPEEEGQVIRHTVLSYAKSLPVPKDGKDDRLPRAMKYYTAGMLKEVLNQANSNKHQELWHKEQREKRKQEAEEKQAELIKKCDANYFFHLIRNNAKAQGKQLIRNTDTFYYLSVLCYFFSNDKRFETELGFNQNKGLWVRGEPGRGKTFPLQCLTNNELQPFEIHSMIAVSNEVASNGSYEINEPLRVIDDVGSEQAIVNHYGTKINWFKDFIELYYANNKPFNRLIITTNLDFQGIEDLYGFRVRSRLREMFNIIDVKGEDLRG